MIENILTRCSDEVRARSIVLLEEGRVGLNRDEVKWVLRLIRQVERMKLWSLPSLRPESMMNVKR